MPAEVQLIISVKEAIAKLRTEFAHLNQKQFDQKVAVVLNQSIRAARTASGKAIRDRFSGLKLQTIRNAQTLSLANAGRLISQMNVKGRPVPISSLSPRQLKKGVSFNLTGKRQVMQRTFLKKGGGSMMLAFARGKYVKAGNSGFTFSKGGRYPIDVIRTVSVPGAMASSSVYKAIEARVALEFEQKASKTIANYIERRGI